MTIEGSHPALGFAEELFGDDLEDWEEPDRWLEAFPIGSREAWQDKREFAGTSEEGELGVSLLAATRCPRGSITLVTRPSMHDEYRRRDMSAARPWRPLRE